MKPLAALFTAVLAIWGLSVQTLAAAENPWSLDSLYEEFGGAELESALPEEAYDYWGTPSIRDAANPENMLRTLWTSLSGTPNEIFTSAVRGAASVLLLCLITAALQSCAPDARSEMLIALVGAAVVSLLCIQEVNGCVSLGFHVIDALDQFSGRLLPALCAAAAASGALTSAGTKFAAASLSLDLFSSAAIRLIQPMIGCFTALIVSGGVLNSNILMTAGTWIKRVLRLFLIGTCILFTGYLSITGILSGSADAVASKTAKAAISTALPVVGGILSNAADCVVSGAGMLRSMIGSLGVLCVLAVCLIPYLSLGVHYLMYQLIGGFVSSFSDKRLAAIVKGFSDVYAMMLGTAGTVTFMIFASIVSLMRAMNG